MSRPRQTITVLSVEQLAAHPGNIRDDLGDLEDMARSIREHGILQPLTVTEHATDPDRYLILDGHRRLAAAILAHESKAPCIVRHHLDDLAEQTIVMLVTGVHRRAVAPVERAKGYGILRDAGLNNSEIARRVGVTPSTVTNYLNLLRLPEEDLEKVETGEFPVVDAVAAVRETRQAERIQAGTPKRGRPVMYFGPTHRFAEQVRLLCSHPHEMQVGGIGCGPCWETVIVAGAAPREDVA